ncbi:MAG: TonB-dependent receptor [Gammaproteobacteria bacterium]|nr:TonB-dependent receptor [Gammaproteobacteria bacterium]QOJ32333.1 MAG: TonB-dependent receptor [Gammaproteobacteria bacterium]
MPLVNTRARGFLPALALALALASPATVLAGGVPTAPGNEVVVIGRLDVLEGAPLAATEGVVTQEQLDARPLGRTGEILEVVPGLIVTQHSGDGKANQYFLRGFNLDHGTDLATSVDDVPVNMPTHGHGQGYTDINFVIPELVQEVEYRKGTYYADAGNFAAAGTVNLAWRDRLDQPFATLEGGEYGYRRALLAGSLGLAGGDLLLAADYTGNDGPWDLDENLSRLNALGRYSRATDSGRLSLTLQAYDADWDATDQIPRRAVDAGLIDRFGAIDRSDGGASHRYSLAAHADGALGAGHYRALAYAVDYRMALYSNFTYATDPVDGDQFEQLDDRSIYGGSASWSLPLPSLGQSGALQLGTDLRYDDIGTVGLYNTVARRRTGTVREDAVKHGSIAAFASLDTRWLDWLRTNLGLRADYFHFDVDSNIAANSGTESASELSPKLSVVFGPWRQTEFFANAGKGFHSNDARGTTIRVDPTDPSVPVSKVDPLVDAFGSEVGLRTALLPRTQLSLGLWQLRLDSELLFVGDAGITEPNRKSERRGLEFSVIHSPLDWLVLDLDLAWTHARFDEPDPNDPAAGDRIPGAVDSVAALGIAIDHPSGWTGGLRIRHFGPAPLVEDNSVRSEATTVVNLEAGYRLTPRVKLTATLLNLFDAEDNDITYYYESQLPGEPAPVADIHFHPVEPRTLRLALTAGF